MESSYVIIARLVLGYLKSEQCRSAYKEFLKTSNHLQDDIGLGRSKYLPTRFVGLTLEDILSEYFEIYKIVQGRLESTNYYNERHPNTSLVHQLLYLLNKALSSRTSTPCPRSPVDSNLDDTSISPAEHVSDVETTPAHTLPGNMRSTSADLHLHKSPWRKSHSKLDKSTTGANFPSPNKEDISEVLAQTLLENREFHEKIAHTINKVAEKQNRMSSELDKTIKTVVKQTEEDPIFDKILDEIIGSTNIIESKDIETSSCPSSATKNVHENIDSRWKRTQRYSDSVHEYDTGYRSYTDSQKVEEQNDEAVRSIVANSKLCSNKHADNHEPQENNEVIVFDGSLDKYLRTNTCNANTQTQPVQNPLYINTTGGLLVVPSGLKSGTENVQMDIPKQYFLVNNQPTVNWNAPTGNPSIITERDILAMPTVIVNDKNTPTKTLVEPPLLNTASEPPKPQQIVAKPVIEIPNVNEYFSFQAAIESHQRGLKKVLYPKSTRRRKPSETSVNSKTSNISEAAVNSKASNTSEAPVSAKTSNSSEASVNSKTTKTSEAAVNSKTSSTSEAAVNSKTSKTSEAAANSKTSSTSEAAVNSKTSKTSEAAVNSKTSNTVVPKTKGDAISVLESTVSLPKELNQIEKDRPLENNIDNDSQESVKPQTNRSENKTPPVSQTSQKITPKSASHVRNLDFSTPPKITSTHKKTMKSKQGSKSPLAHKKQAVKTLFKSKDSEISDKSGHVSEINSKCNPKKNRQSSDVWDADLRAIVPPVEKTTKGTPKRKRTTPVKRTKKKVRKASKEMENRMNTTEHDAALLEAALLTPLKSGIENIKTEEIAIEEHRITENICVLPENEHENNSEGKTKNNYHTKIASGERSESKRKSKESPENIPNKLILSPSKLNSSKRNLLKTDIFAPNLMNETIEDTNKFITPEMVKETVNYPIKANRNITPMLETPLKNEFIPKTPRLLTPSNPAHDLNMSILSNGLTPFTKMLEANLKGIDINSLPTPNIPITPSFPPFTPTVDLISPYSNRPTDYSTSSSYYQPSDSEQNKSLEANLIELEKKPIAVHSDVLVQEEIVASVNENGKEINENVIVTVIASSESEIKNEVSKNDLNKFTRANTIKEHLSIFNKNVIGKKNLSLMKRNMSSSSNSSDESTSESSSNADNSWNGEQSNETVIFKKKPPETPKRIYSLRNRCISANNKEETISKSTNTKETLNRNESDQEVKTNANPKPNSKINSKQIKDTTTVSKPKGINVEETTKDTKRSVEITNFKRNVLKELEEKRLRTINKFKTAQKTPPNKPAKVSKQSKFIKIKPIANVTNTRRKPRKSTSPKKAVRKTDDVNKTSSSNGSKENSKKSPMSHTSRDRDKSVDKSASDVEAQNLIEGLKERGIHLMHNKSPIKKLNSTSSESKVDDERTKIIERVKLKNDCTTNKDDMSISISPEATKHELSTSQLESELRETYDTQVFEEYECVIFDDTQSVTKTLEDYETILKKKFVGKVFIEEIDAEIDVPLVLSPFITLFDFPSTFDLNENEQVEELQKINDARVPQLKKINCKKDNEKPDTNKDHISLIRDVTNPSISDEALKSDDELMNYAIVGSGKEETPERSESPRSTRKRKNRNEENSHTEKKCKTLLQHINVDSFLNNIHGGS